MERILAPAKLNLSLAITGRRGDGYLLLRSRAAFADWGDELWISPARGFSLELAGEFAGDIDDPLDTTLHKAWREASRRRPGIGGARVRLVKNIPVGAGLGGGSSDAARFIKRLGLTDGEAYAIAEKVGADVPVCLYGRPAVMSGCGEKISPYECESAGLPMLVIWPRKKLSSREVMQAFKDSPTAHTGGGDGGDVGNDLLPYALRYAPEVAEILDILGSTGAAAHGMSGSGSACFAIYRTIRERDGAAEKIPQKHWVKKCGLAR